MTMWYAKYVVNLYSMRSGLELRKHPRMMELSSPSAETLMKKPPILPLVRTFSRQVWIWTPVWSLRAPYPWHIVWLSRHIWKKKLQADPSSPDSGRNSKKRSLDDDDETTHPTAKSCIEVALNRSLAPALAPSGNGGSKKRTRDRYCYQVRLRPR